MVASRDDSSSSEPPSGHVPWQYSLRSLLAFTAIVSICMAIGVHFTGFLFIVLVFGLIQAGMLLTADWLIRPANRGWLALATAAAWIGVGSGLMMIGAGEIYHRMMSWKSPWGFGIGFIIAAAFCYVLAVRRWRQLTGRSDATSDRNPTTL